MLVRTILAMLFFLTAGSTWSATITVVADSARPVSTKALTQWFNYPWLKNRLNGKDFISEITTFQDPSDSNNDDIRFVAALPPLDGEAGPVYLVRSTNRGGRCNILYFSNELQELLPDTSDFDCALETVTIVRSRATCSAGGGTWDPRMEHPDEFCVKGNKVQCNERGGEWRRSGMFSRYICVVPYPDGGKPCSDHSECLGGCYIDGSNPRNVDTQGRCRKTNSPHFCLEGVSNGRRSGRQICAE